MAKTVLITGTSSGLGLACAKLFADKGWNVVASMRKPSCKAGEALSLLSNVIVVPLDVTDDESIKAGVRLAQERFGTIDVLVNNAGYALTGPLEVATREQMEMQFQTNVIGPARLMQKVLPSMRKAQSGVIVNVGSAGGQIALPLRSFYVASKFALGGMTESAAMELEPFGIKVRLVEPGGIKTTFVSNAVSPSATDVSSVYEKICAEGEKMFNASMGNASDAVDIAGVVYEAATTDSDRFRFVAGKDAQDLIALRKGISDEQHRQNMMTMFHIS